ncbi:MAG: peroxiredoxin family protein [Vicinamibacteraceae bacterium]
MMLLLLATVLLAGVFAVAGIVKLDDRAGSHRMLAGFGVPAGMVVPLGWVLVTCELGVALALLLGPTAPGGALGALVLLLGLSGAVAVNLARGRTPECHCFGRLHAAPVGWSTVARNGLLATIAGFVVADGRAPLVFAALGVVTAILWIGPGLVRSWRRRLGVAAPGFSLPDEAGRTWTLDALLARRRPLLLVFSHPACVACTALLPEIATWQSRLDGRMTVAVVSGGSPEDNHSEAHGHGLRRVLLDEDRTVASAYGVTATPSAVLIARDGNLAAAPARGAGEILALVSRVIETPERTTVTRRALLGRAALGLPVAALLLILAPRWAAARSAGRVAAAAGAGGGGHGGFVCFQRYALCTSAPCELSPTDPSIAVCQCFVEDGPSFGNTACEQRAAAGDTLYSAFSLQNVTSSSTVMTCPSGSPWANCLDVVCTVDPANPMQAICQCVTVKTGSSVTFGGDCDTSTCSSVIWSGATTDMIEQAISAYTAAVQPRGIPVLLPTKCT